MFSTRSYKPPKEKIRYYYFQALVDRLELMCRYMLIKNGLIHKNLPTPKLITNPGLPTKAAE
jgi:hypothetical protein